MAIDRCNTTSSNKANVCIVITRFKSQLTVINHVPFDDCRKCKVQSNSLGEMQILSSQLQNKNKEKKQFLIEDRRRRVASLLAQSRTETEIATDLQVHVSTISRDVTYLRKQSQQFVYDLAKSDLAFYYKQCLDGIEEVRRKSWEIYNNDRSNQPNCYLNNAKVKLLCLKLIKECNESKFALLKDGPSIINLRMLEDRISKIESR